MAMAMGPSLRQSGGESSVNHLINLEYNRRTENSNNMNFNLDSCQAHTYKIQNFSIDIIVIIDAQYKQAQVISNDYLFRADPPRESVRRRLPSTR